MALNFAVRPQGEGRSLLTSETRVATTDVEAGRRFRRYWRVIILRRAIVDDYVETARQAGRGQVSDWAIIFCPWGFNLRDIRVPVHFWQGEDDRSVPVAAARAQAAAIPWSRLTVYPGEAHLAFFTHRAEILRDLTKEA